MTLRELSKELGIPFTTLGNYERGDREPNFEVLNSIAGYFNVSIDYLSGRTNIRNTATYTFNIGFNQLKEAINETSPQVRDAAENVFTKMSYILREGIKEEDVDGLLIIQEILAFFMRMKIGFFPDPYAELESEPRTPFELAKLFIQEKHEVDELLNALFDVYSREYLKKIDKGNENN